MRAQLAAVCLLCLAALATAQKPKTRLYINQREAADAAASISMMDRRTLFNQWKAENGKAYANAAAENAAFAQFSATVNDLVSHNSDGKAKFFKGLHEYADVPFADFAAKRLMKGITPEGAVARGATAAAKTNVKTNAKAGRKLAQTPPAAWDWRALGKVPPARNQGGCGSCWAFAAIGALESKALIDGTTFSGDLSEQQMVDCVNSALGYGSAGCNGGYSSDVLSYVAGFRATTEADYRYTATMGTCQEPKTGHTAVPGSLTVTGYMTIAPNKAAIQSALYLYGPIVVYFNVINSFYSYTGGIYPAAGCPTNTINHAMLLVGYDFTGPTPYWIIRNSWGTGWGTEGGYVKVEATDDSYGACRMYTALYLPRVTSAVGN
ncbi:hypothetical protein COHA_010797, partial [Chlorella ohadii]